MEPTAYQDFIYTRTYARWLDEEGRREFWPETVNRYRNFFRPRIPVSKLDEFEAACDAVERHEVMPSMRALWAAGKALERENICAFNCAYTPVDNPRVFAEILYILMCGTGIGYSVERQYIAKLPEIPTEIVQAPEVEILFADSKLGWAEGFYRYLMSLWKGKIPVYNLSRIRPKGARLKTMGGRASGPEPLKQLLDFSLQLFVSARGRKLNSLECHDLCCYVANIVVVGGVRRSAMISLSNFSDKRMAHAKDGEFWSQNPQRSMANNSVAYTEQPDAISFMDEWLNLARSRSGERGIFNREGSKFVASMSGRRDVNYEFGCNPCFTGDMRLFTAEGYRRFGELDGLNVNVVNHLGRVTSGRVWCSGEKEVVEVVMEGSESERTVFRCTPDHVFMLADGTSCEARSLPQQRLAPYEHKREKVREALRLQGNYVRLVRPVGMRKVYDFSEPETHWGVVEGFVVHNCSEIILRPAQFCNLSEVVVRAEDDLEALKRKVRLATVLGAVQSTLTEFGFIGREWKKNTEEERLLGVSLTGLRDHAILGRKSSQAGLWLREMKEAAIEAAREWSQALEINMPAAITCVKPSGTVSQLNGVASGLHPRHAPFYIRRVRVNRTDPVAQYMIDRGVPWHPEVGQDADTCSTVVFEFPIRTPEQAICRDQVSALDQLEYWKMLQECWCEHKPSATIYVKDHEWLEVGAWVYRNWRLVSGISFLPYDGGIYQLAPYQEITEDEYLQREADFPELDFGELAKYESQDMTLGAKEYACVGGSCEL